MSGILKPAAATFDWGFGQILSACACIPCLIALFNLRSKIPQVEIAQIPMHVYEYFSDGLCYILTGNRKWTDQDTQDRDYFSWKYKWIISTCIPPDSVIIF